MKNLILKLLLLHTLNLLGFSSSAQKYFKLTIKFPQTINSEKAEVWLNNGKLAKKIKPQSSTRDELVLMGEYYSLYAAVTLQYPPNATVKGFSKDFFVGEKPGRIIFTTARTNDLPFENYSLLNVIDFFKEKNAMDNFSAVERKEAMDYESR